jgi:hypothetical protein
MWVSTGTVERGGGMARLMHGKSVLFFRLNRHGANRAHHHLIARLVQINGCKPALC